MQPESYRFFSFQSWCNIKISYEDHELVCLKSFEMNKQ